MRMHLRVEAMAVKRDMREVCLVTHSMQPAAIKALGVGASDLLDLKRKRGGTQREGDEGRQSQIGVETEDEPVHLRLSMHVTQLSATRRLVARLR